MKILVLNCGSSTVKVALIDHASGERILKGAAERLGSTEATVTLEQNGERRRFSPGDGTHAGVISLILDELRRRGLEPDVVGHRIVHGGALFSQSVVVSDEVLANINALAGLAPLHNPASASGIEAVRTHLPNVTQTATFDTAFHQTLPAKAYRYAVPKEWYSQHNVRRYGFHGISYRYVAPVAAEMLGLPLDNSRLAIAHLGNGASVSAVLNGASVDTSMGLSPLQGLVMGTRSGDIDPAVIAHMATRTGRGAEEIVSDLNSKSGLLGLSNHSNDMRTLVDAAEAGNERAALAIEIFSYRLATYLASYLVPLGGLDGIVFTGGIGENNAVVRSRVIAELSALGLVEDPEANAINGRETLGRITSPESAVPAIVVNTDEELLIARDAAALVGAS